MCVQGQNRTLHLPARATLCLAGCIRPQLRLRLQLELGKRLVNGSVIAGIGSGGYVGGATATGIATAVEAALKLVPFVGDTAGHYHQAGSRRSGGHTKKKVKKQTKIAVGFCW